MDSKSVLDYAAETDPFRHVAQNSQNIRRSTPQEVSEQKERGDKVMLWKQDAAKGARDFDERLDASSDAGCLTSTSSQASTDSNGTHK
jgi:hypothetical protein